jgi:hypothetical protein
VSCTVNRWASYPPPGDPVHHGVPMHPSSKSRETRRHCRPASTFEFETEAEARSAESGCNTTILTVPGASLERYRHCIRHSDETDNDVERESLGRRTS